MEKSGPRLTANRKQQKALLTLLRQLRQKAGLRQADMAQKLGKPQAFVSYYESVVRRLGSAGVKADLSDSWVVGYFRTGRIGIGMLPQPIPSKPQCGLTETSRAPDGAGWERITFNGDDGEQYAVRRKGNLDNGWVRLPREAEGIDES